jgi:hypothetical protein
VSMQWGFGARVAGAGLRVVFRPDALLMAICAVGLGACSLDERPMASAAQPRGASVAFESIDGPPPGPFQQLVQDLNNEAQARRLAVVSRESQSAYRVRGYVSAATEKGQTTIAWVWDVFDGDQHRALRIEGEETAKGNHADAWAAADEAMLNRIARSSMDQLATFLTSPEVAPSASEEPGMTLVGLRNFSPEAAGIFRIFQAHADPVAAEPGEPPAAAADPIVGPVPLPRHRPALPAAVSARETLTLAASRR